MAPRLFIGLAEQQLSEQQLFVGFAQLVFSLTERGFALVFERFRRCEQQQPDAAELLVRRQEH